MLYPLVNYKNYGKSQFLKGQLIISMAMFNSNTSLPEGIYYSVEIRAFFFSMLSFSFRFRSNSTSGFILGPGKEL